MCRGWCPSSSPILTVPPARISWEPRSLSKASKSTLKDESASINISMLAASKQRRSVFVIKRIDCWHNLKENLAVSSQSHSSWRRNSPWECGTWLLCFLLLLRRAELYSLHSLYAEHLHLEKEAILSHQQDLEASYVICFQATKSNPTFHHCPHEWSFPFAVTYVNILNDTQHFRYALNVCSLDLKSVCETNGQQARIDLALTQ